DIVAVVELAHRDGYAIDDGNYIAGVTALAVPVLNTSGQAIGAVTALALSGQLEHIGQRELIADLKHAGTHVI
ncbi:MAG: hypothetical protein HOH04_07580, partial [Rhodospirillaceae bacterium]|nr:hypothetical protein [Rhodospirillaceae bacterium]